MRRWLIGRGEEQKENFGSNAESAKTLHIHSSTICLLLEHLALGYYFDMLYCRKFCRLYCIQVFNPCDAVAYSIIRYAHSPPCADKGLIPCTGAACVGEARISTECSHNASNSPYMARKYWNSATLRKGFCCRSRVNGVIFARRYYGVLQLRNALEGNIVP